jgi:hypothetical protein
MYGQLNSAQDVLAIPESMLAAQIALADNDRQAALKCLEAAAQSEDSLNYMEPPDWYIPVRETLGRLLLKAGEPAAAEKAFRTDLEKHARNGRSLFGLYESLRAQGKMHAAESMQLQFRSAWKNADTELRLDDL